MSKAKNAKSKALLWPENQDTLFQAPLAHPLHEPSGAGDNTTTAALTAPLSALATGPQVVQIIDTTTWSKPSPDPSGMAFIPGGKPGTGTLLMSDSEIDETPFFRPD